MAQRRVAKKPARKWITDVVERSFSDRLEGDITKAITFLKTFKPNKVYRRYWIDMEYSYNDYDRDRLILKGERLENDKEYNERLKFLESEGQRLKQFKEDQEARELREFERLKKKFAK